MLLLTCVLRNGSRKVTMMTRKRKLTSDQAKEICRRYKDSESSPQLGTIFNVSGSTIRYLLERHGIPRRSRRDAQLKYPCNEAAFDIITEESAYWIGFLMADGSICDHKSGSPEIALALSAKDKEHLEQFRSFLQSSHSIVISSRRIKTGEYLVASFRVRSFRLTKALAAFGVVPRKSLTTHVIGLEDNRHFWRGVIDGDGHLTHHLNHRNRCSRLQLVGSQTLLQQFADFIRPYMPGKSLTVRPHKSIYEICLYGLSAIRAMDLLYHPCSIALLRKKAIADEIPMLL